MEGGGRSGFWSGREKEIFVKVEQPSSPLKVVCFLMTLNPKA